MFTWRTHKTTAFSSVDSQADPSRGGDRNCGLLGDGAPAAAAQLNQPTGLAFDAQGNLFFADTGNQRVRYISPQGIIQTVAGAGGAGSAGDGGPATTALSMPLPDSLSIPKEPCGSLMPATIVFAS